MSNSIIKTIAQKLNVSTASVSRALNDRPGVSNDLRALILDKARELNYSPNLTARALATSTTMSIGFFMAEKPGLSTYTDPFYGHILHGVEQALAQSDYQLTIATLTKDILASPDTFRFVREKRIDGMLLAGPDIPSPFVLRMHHSHIPVVLIDNRLEHSSIDSVTSDEETGGYLAASYLLGLGHKEIGIISGPSTWSSNRRRANACIQTIHEADAHCCIIHATETTIDSGKWAAAELLDQYPHVTAIFAVNDSMGIGAIRMALERGIQVPQDLSIIGYDNITWSALNDQPLTTINVPKPQLGVEAAKRLLTILTTPDLDPTNLTIAVKLIERVTCAPVAIRR